MLRPLAGALATLAIAAPAAAAHESGPPDAAIFATNNTAVITDPDDPRLDDRLKEFARQVERMIDDGGGDPEGSRLLDGVFFSSDEGTTTFERSRGFDVDSVEDDELHTIADAVRARFQQQSVLIFDHLRPDDAEVNSILLEAPGVTAQALRDGLLADQDARERLFGGSVTQDNRLLLVAGLEDAGLANDFAEQIGADMRRAVIRYGERAFVDGPSPVRVEQRTLIVEGGSAALAVRGSRLEVDLGADGTADFEVSRHRFDRVRVQGGDDLDTLSVRGTPGADRFDVTAAGDRVRIVGDERIELDGVDKLRLEALDGADRVEVGDLSATDVFQVDADLGAGLDKAEVDGSDDDDQISLTSFSPAALSVLGPTFVRFEQPEAADRLTVDGRGGDDIVSASTGAMALTLAGGDGDNVLLGGPGDDVLLGGPGEDACVGGDGSDRIDCER
jgi:RTX calcium-binding nonapeptide repeat (4 copies)